ncbi:MAG: HAMP domain-containing histidine kinase [Verrucomicrobia bacterium]|nr:HAMP domain-containing histidine kinase [Verrucomicrobiota bacterium]
MDDVSPASPEPILPGTPAPASHPNVSSLPWAAFMRVLRRLSHNLRNYVNTAELEAAFAQEITDDPEVRASLTRLRRSLGKVADECEHLLTRVADPLAELIELSGNELFQAIRQESERRLGSAVPITWEWQGGDAVPLYVDPDLMCRIMRELLDNAARYRLQADRPIRIRAGAKDAAFELEIIEPKTGAVDLSTWGIQPFTSTEPGRYGLGTWAAHRWALATGANLDRWYDAEQSSLVTRLTLNSRTDSDDRG